MSYGTLARCAASALVTLACAGPPQTIERSSRTEALHPVTGQPIPRLLSEAEEVRAAARQHQAIRAAHGGRIDPPGEHTARLRRVFHDLALVTHRRKLPWQAHLIENAEAGAFTTGAGFVYVSAGSFGEWGLLTEGDDDELAALLAHQMAHVALLHTRVARTWQLRGPREARDPYDRASFSADQEAEADQLAALYMALSGYDPGAAARLWERVARSDRGAARFTTEHPPHGDRVREVASAAGRVVDYYTPGRQNPDWEAIRAAHPLFPGSAPAVSVASRGGVARSLKAALDAQAARPGAAAPARTRTTTQRPARRPGAQRPEPAPQRGLVKLVKIETGRESNGGRAIQMELYNGANREVIRIGLRVLYYDRSSRPLAEDPSCGGPATIPAGQTAWLLCDLRRVEGAAEYEVQITGVEFR